ncbi:MAG: uncharacterized protein A8A55_0898 [Amphiamblys sp. WSBS2006]|nr:MAG: uncharacterized protein A8A55_0898 [Amphiamblys sp. WSBS2006]
MGSKHSRPGEEKEEGEEFVQSPATKRVFVKEDGGVYAVLYGNGRVCLFDAMAQRIVGEVFLERVCSHSWDVDEVWCSPNSNTVLSCSSGSKRNLFLVNWNRKPEERIAEIPHFSVEGIQNCSVVCFRGEKKTAALATIEKSGTAQFRILDDAENKDKIYQFELCSQKETADTVFVSERQDGVYVLVCKNTVGRVDVFVATYLEQEKEVEMCLVDEVCLGERGIEFQDTSQPLYIRKNEKDIVQLFSFKKGRKTHLMMLEGQALILLSGRDKKCVAVDSEEIVSGTTIVSCVWRGEKTVVETFLVKGGGVVDHAERELSLELDIKRVLQWKRKTVIGEQEMLVIDSRLFFGRHGLTQKTTKAFSVETEFEAERYPKEKHGEVERKRKEKLLLIDVLLEEAGIDADIYPPPTNKDFWRLVCLAEEAKAHAVLEYISRELCVEKECCSVLGWFSYLMEHGQEREALSLLGHNSFPMSPELRRRCFRILNMAEEYREEAIEFLCTMDIPLDSIGRDDIRRHVVSLIKVGAFERAASVARKHECMDIVFNSDGEWKKNVFFTDGEIRELSEKRPESPCTFSVLESRGWYKEGLVLAHRVSFSNEIDDTETIQTERRRLSERLTPGERLEAAKEAGRRGMLPLEKQEKEEACQKLGGGEEHEEPPKEQTPRRDKRRLEGVTVSVGQKKQRETLLKIKTNTPTRRTPAPSTPRRSTRKKQPPSVFE